MRKSRGTMERGAPARRDAGEINTQSWSFALRIAPRRVRPQAILHEAVAQGYRSALFHHVFRWCGGSVVAHQSSPVHDVGWLGAARAFDERLERATRVDSSSDATGDGTISRPGEALPI